MSIFTRELWILAEGLLAPRELARTHELVKANPIVFDDLLEVDEMIGGACMTQVTNQAGNGQYHVEDRDVFRPLQYCAMYFYRKCDMTEVESFTRAIVQMAGLHIESLLNRMGGVFGFTLGRALHDNRVSRRIGPVAWAQADSMRRIYNVAKHDVDHDMDTHMFSVEDAVLAYLVSRKLGEAFYPKAKLKTHFPKVLGVKL